MCRERPKLWVGCSPNNGNTKYESKCGLDVEKEPLVVKETMYSGYTP